MSGKHDKNERRAIRHMRIRRKVRGSDARPRLSVYRSASHIYAQIIDDAKGVTLVAASSHDAESAEGEKKSGKVGLSTAVGKLLAERAKAKGISSVSFDRGGYLYHGRVRALAEGARSGGLQF
jgi:large subunit ribosomal protein L18